MQQYLRALGAEVDLDSGIASGDEFDLIVEYKRAATGEIEAGKLLYAGLLRGGKPRKQLMRWGSDGTFYEASGVGEQRAGLLMPVASRGVSSGYGMRRHPILGYSRMHRGHRLPRGYGSPIYAVSRRHGASSPAATAGTAISSSCRTAAGSAPATRT